MATIRQLQGSSLAEASIDDAYFGERHNPVVLREAVLMYEANKRQGTASTRTRRFVSGSTKKIYKQKHTGRARHGDRKAPIFRGGGVAHGPHPRDFSYKMPRKALRKALQVALAGKVRDGEICQWDGAGLGEKPSTKTIAKVLATLGDKPSALFVTAGPVDKNLLLSVRNLPYARALPANEVSAYDVVAHRHLVLLEGALEALHGRVTVADASEEAND